MNLGIDATNVTQGGGITHISSIMNSTNKELLKFKKIIIWGNNKTLKTIKKRKNLKKIDVKIINNKPIKRFFWQLFSLEKQLIKYKCDHALILGGISFLRKIPTTIILQNLLPFDELNIIKYRFIKRFKLYLQKFFFSNSINNAKNIIFLSNSSKKKILSVLKKKVKNYKVIPHGIDKKLILKKITKKRIFSKKKLFKILYVSKIEFYKNQIDLLKVAKNLNEKNYKIIVDFLGPFYEPSLKKFNYYQDIIDPQKKFTKYIGEKSLLDASPSVKDWSHHVRPIAELVKLRTTWSCLVWCDRRSRRDRRKGC